MSICSAETTQLTVKMKEKWPGFLENYAAVRHLTFACFLELSFSLCRVPYQLFVTGLERVQLNLGDLTLHNRTKKTTIKIQVGASKCVTCDMGNQRHERTRSKNSLLTINSICYQPALDVRLNVCDIQIIVLKNLQAKHK